MLINKQLKRCEIDGKEVKLRKKELEILVLLLEHRNRIFSRGEILSRIWPDEVIVLDRVIDVNITRLRQAIGEYGKQIITRSGYGYGFMDK
jgi:two-component system phosphate regulon response regulator PhoB